MRRRQLLSLATTMLAAVSLPVLAQRRARRIGYFGGGSLQNNVARLAAYRQGMAALRWVEGRDYVIDARYADAVASAFEGLAAELVAIQPDLLLASGDTVARLLAERTKTIPIVFGIGQDSVGNGVAASLAHPGGNAGIDVPGARGPSECNC